MARIARLDDVFSAILELEESPVGGQLLQQKIRKREKGKGEKKKKKKKKKPERPKDVGDYLVQKLEILIYAHARAKMS